MTNVIDVELMEAERAPVVVEAVVVDIRERHDYAEIAEGLKAGIQAYRLAAEAAGQPDSLSGSRRRSIETMQRMATESIIKVMEPVIEPLVWKRVNSNSSNDLADELRGAAHLGLAQSVVRANLDKPAMTIFNWARRRIIGSIQDAGRDADHLLSRSARAATKEYFQASEKLETKLQRKPTIDEIKTELEWDETQLAFYSSAIQPHTGGAISLDDMTPDTGNGFESWLSDDYSTYHVAGWIERKARGIDMRVWLSHAFELPGLRISDRDKQIFIMHEVDEMTMQDIANLFNLTEGRISQIRSEILLKLGNHFDEHKGDWETAKLY